MDKIFYALDELKKINEAYENTTENIDALYRKAREAKVCTPIIGKFSSGKSALVNTLLGYSRKILKEDITPETAVPAEILYTEGEDGVTVIQNDGNCKELSIDEYRSFEADATGVKCVRIQLRQEFLREIPDVMLVDMPGFESGFEIHNKAIDNYLPQSLTYIIAFPADDMIVRSSVGNILKELCLHDMPLCIVITKYDKKGSEYDETLAKLKENLKRFVGDRELTFCETSSFTGDAEELEGFLREIQTKSQQILSDSLAGEVLAVAESTENYLKTVLNGSRLSESELNEQEEKLNGQLSKLATKLEDERDNFDLELAECIEEIKGDVQCALEAEEENLVAMAINNQSINEYINNVIRNAVTVSVKKRFLTRMEKYLKRVTNEINADSMGDVHVSFYFNGEQAGKGAVAATVAGVAAVLTGGLLLGGILGLLIGAVSKFIKEKKREEAKQQARMKLRGEVFPQVLREVGNRIETEIKKQVKLVNTTIEEEFTSQKEILEKAIADVRNRISDEKTMKENLEIDVKNDLERIGEIKDGLR